MTAAVIRLPVPARPAAPALELTLGQRQALGLLERAVEEKLKFAVVAGYAGTGKTTLLKLAKHLRPLLLAPTGKAALRLREATDWPAFTIHRAIYAAFEDNDGDVYFSRRGADSVVPTGCKVVVVDEASMVAEKVFDDLVLEAGRLGLPVVFVGDPAQLPPVAHRGDAAFSVLKLATPHRAELKEVLRQAESNPIVAASMQLRRGEWREALASFPKVDPDFVVEEAYDVYQRGGAVICHTNRTRAALNAALRDLQGYPAQELQPYEPLLVLRNNYRLDVYNGEVVTFAGWERAPAAVRWTSRACTVHLGIAKLDVHQVAGEPPRRERAWVCQEVVDGRFDGREVRRLAKDHGDAAAPDGEPLTFLQAEYGYALTVHKSQGSEWRDVMVVVEPTVPVRDREGWQWLYTATTRARERVRLHFGLGGIPPAPAGRIHLAPYQPAQGRLF